MNLFPWLKKSSAVRKRNFVVRGFDAAAVDRLLAGWKWDGGFDSVEIGAQLATLRARSREMTKNNPHLRRFVDMFAVNIVGEGFAFKSTPYDIIKGIRKIDEAAASLIEEHYYRWASNPQWCDAAGRKTIAQIDRLNAKTWARDGEYFMLIDRNAQNPYGLSLRVLRPDFIPEWYHSDAVDYTNPNTGERIRNNNVVRCGIEMDRVNMRPTAYYVQTSPQYAWVTTMRGPLTRIPASMMIHGFEQDDEDQPRGVPLSHAVLRKLKMLDEFDKAELTAARDEACSVRTYYAPKGDEDALADLTSEENADVANSLTAQKEAGQAEVLPIGWKSEVNTPQHPNREVTPFKVSMLKDVATGLNVEYSEWASDWSGVSYSSVRAGTISQRDTWMTRQDSMIAQSKTPVFLAWLNNFLRLEVSGNLPLAKADKFAQHLFRARRWMWVDPSNDMRAAEIAVSRGWKTNSQISAELGEDFGDNCDVLRVEKQKANGLALGPVNPNAQVNGDTNVKT